MFLKEEEKTMKITITYFDAEKKPVRKETFEHELICDFEVKEGQDENLLRKILRGYVFFTLFRQTSLYQKVDVIEITVDGRIKWAINTCKENIILEHACGNILCPQRVNP